jgi:cytohesin
MFLFPQKTLHEAAMLGDLMAVEFLLKEGKRPSEEDKEHYTPLHWAVAKGHVHVARQLIEFGADLEKRGGRFLLTPLHMAAGEGHLNTSRLLLDAGAHVNSLDRFRNSPMHWAAWFGHLSVVRFLVERGGNYTLTNRDGYTPRDMASVRRSWDIVQWFDVLKDVP